MVNVQKHCWNLHNSTFILFIGHLQVTCVRKSLSYWHAKSWDCFLTQWLPIKRILLLNKDNLTIPIQMQLSQKQKLFSEFFATFLKSTINFKYFEKRIWSLSILYFPNYGLRKCAKNSCFRGSFEKQHGKRAQALFKSSSQLLFSYSLTTAKSIELENVSVIDMPNLGTAC